MVSRFTLALPVAILGVALLAPPGHAQGRGMRGSVATPRGGRSSIRIGGRGDIGRQGQRRFLNNPAFLWAPYFYDDGFYDDGNGDRPVTPGVSQVQLIVSTPDQQPAPPAKAIEPLLLEIRDGKWVRVPTASQMQVTPDSTEAVSVQSSTLQIGTAGVSKPVPELPPAQIVFRDGHTEEAQKYMIQDGALYISSDYWTTGSWTRKIPLAILDIPATLKLNKDRGTKFNLPSGPNEVAIRF